MPENILLLLLLLFAIGLGLFIQWGQTRYSGWPTLAERFPGGERPAGRVLSGQVISLGPARNNVFINRLIGAVGYNVFATNLVISQAGLYLYPIFLLRVFRRPILVPWREVVDESRLRPHWAATHRLRVGGETMMEIRDKAFKQLLPFLTVVAGIIPE